jgi:serine/threonine protein kinase
MYGVSIDGPQFVLVLEYCAGGSLDRLLFDDNRELSEEMMLKWIRRIAAGMYHLHRFNVIHRDLAARNILLTKTGEPKVSDFGLSRFLQEGTVERQTLSTVGPVCWMSPESLKQKTYSKKTDVWMFGMLVYEIVARREPHSHMSPYEAVSLIRDTGLTPEIPSNCPPLLRNVMERCWQIDPNRRPSFEDICLMLNQSHY